MQRKFFLFLVVTVLGNIAAPSGKTYLQGKVVDASNGKPLDSVRVASSSYATSTFTDSDGTFTLTKHDTVACRPDTRIIESVVDYAIDFSIATRNYRFVIISNPQPFTVTLSDLSGRATIRFTLTPPHYSFTRTPRVAPGVYIATITGFKPVRIVVSSHADIGKISRETITRTTVITPDCIPKATETDSIIFCKRGYVLFTADTATIAASGCISLKQKHWIAWDNHNHSILTDGSELLDTVVGHAFGTGDLDLYVNSEHGGLFGNDTLGRPIMNDPTLAVSAPRFRNAPSIPRWFSIVNYSWPKLLSLRKRYPGKILLQGLEWNVPGHEHANVGFVDDNDQPAAVADFEYQFDFDDTDTGRPSLKKGNDYAHANALTALHWLKARYPSTSYCFINHPSREAIGPYHIAAFRDFNNAAPDICFGYEGMPGHHKTPIRGKYGYASLPRNRTWGGADHVLSQVGGIWDALLGEGRRFFTIVNSDFHHRAETFFPGEYAKTWSTVTDTGAQAWLDGLRTGEIFIAHGDLIRALDFTIDDGIKNAPMGSELHTRAREITIDIRFRSPANNLGGISPRVDHVDLITGAITGKIDLTDQVAYNNPANPTTKVALRFETADFSEDNGWRTMRATLPIAQSAYFRLRGTNLAVGTAGEVDDTGNPEIDVDYKNNEAVAWNDLWFYSNPIFVYVK